MALPYRQVKDLYDLLAATGATTKSLPEWSAEMGQLTGSDFYSEGLHDNLIKRASVGIDRALESVPGLIEHSRAFGESAGGLVGMPEEGAKIGEGLPRMAANFLPMLIPGVGEVGAAGVALNALRLGAMGAMSGSQTYTETGSPAAGFISAATNMVMPKVADLAEQGALKYLGGRHVTGALTDSIKLDQGAIKSLSTSPVSRYFANDIGQSAAAYGAGQAAAAGLMGASDIAQQAFAGQPIQNPLTPEFGLNLILGQLPFAGLHLATKAAGLTKSSTAQADLLEAAIQKTNSLLTLKKAQEELAQKTDLEKIPDVAPNYTSLTAEQQAVFEDTQARLAKIRNEQAKIMAAPDGTAEQVERLNSLLKEDASLTEQVAGVSKDTVLGVAQGPTAEHVGLVGRQIGESPRSRTILVADDPANPDEFRGRVVNYSKGKFEVAPQAIPNTDQTQFAVPQDWHTVLPVREQKAKPNLGPELPVQEQPATVLFDHITALDKIENDIDTATTPAQIQKAIVNLRAVQDTAGLTPINDVQLKRVKAKLDAAGVEGDTAKIALKAKTAQTRRLLQAEELARQQSAVSEWRSAQEAEFAKGEQGDPVVVSRMTEFHDFEKYVSTKGARGAALSDSGRLDQMFYELRNDPDAMGKLRKQVEEALATGKGIPTKRERSVVEEVKEATKDEPLNPGTSFVAEAALRAVVDPRAKKAFDEWKDNDETNWDYERRLFSDWALEFGSVSKDDVNEAAEYFADRDGVGIPEMKDELNAFLARPHVKIWNEVMERELQVRKSNAPRIEGPLIPAGGGFVWGLAPYDEATNKLGGKHTLPKSGELKVEQLKAIGGRGKPLQDVEIDMMKAVDQAVGGGAFDGKGNVNVKKLVQVLKENPVQIETHEYGQEGKVSEAKAELDKMTHEWLETLPTIDQQMVDHAVETRLDKRVPSSVADNVRENFRHDKEKLDRYIELKRQVKAEPPDTSPRATSYYNQISPFDTKKFPVVRVDVVLPRPKMDVERHRELNLLDMTAASYGENKLTEAQKARRKELRAEFNKTTDTLWSPDNLHENLPNTLGWAMVQFVPDPRTGEMVAFVGEQQSRWGQETRKDNERRIKELTANQEYDKKNIVDAERFLSEHDGAKQFPRRANDPEGGAWLTASGETQFSKERAKQSSEKYLHFLKSRLERDAQELSKLQEGKPPHPLLPLQHVLVLKAAIAEAAKRGVKRVVLSDGETAMMTEGHDKQPININAFGAFDGNYKPEVGDWGFRRPDGKIEVTGKDKASTETDHARQMFSISRGLKVDQVTAADLIKGEPPQSGGMRLHYDTTLPSAMRKLTGEEGERVEMGVHKNATDQNATNLFDDRIAQARSQVLDGRITEEQYRQYIAEVQAEYRAAPVGSPVFRNPDGTPKSSVTGLSFDSSKAAATSEAQGGFTLGDPSRAPAREPKAFVPTTEAAAAISASLTGDGHHLLRTLTQSPSEFSRAIASDLLKNFPEALKRVRGEVREVPGTYILHNSRQESIIHFDPSLISEAPWARENTILHELIHGLTVQELESSRTNPELQGKFTALRQRLIDALPKHLRKSLDAALASDWYSRFQQADETEAWNLMGELSPKMPERQLLYGLLNDREMIAQAFSSVSFRDHMMKTPGEGKKSAWKAFAGWVKELLGLGDKVDDTAFAEFLGLTSQLMSQGEFLSSFANYGERFFENQDKGGVYGKAQTQRALGIVGESAYGLDKEGLLGSLSVGGSFNAELTKRKAALQNALLMKGEDFQHITSILDEHGFDPTVNGLDEFVHAGLTGDVPIHDALEMLPSSAARYVFAKLADYKDVLDLLASATKEKNKGLVNITQPELLRGPVREVQKAVAELNRVKRFQDESAAELARLSNLSPDGFVAGARSNAPKLLSQLTDSVGETAGGVLSWLANFLEPMGQLARRVPEAAEILSKAFELALNARKMFAEGVKVFGMDTRSTFLDVLSHESVKQSEKVFGNPKLLNIVNKWMWWNNKEGGSEVKMLSDSHPEIKKLLANLTPAERADVADLVAKQGKSTQVTNAQKLEKMTQIAAINGAAVALADTGMKTRDNLALSDTLLRAVVDMNDPLKQAMAMTRVQQVQSKMSIEGFNNLLTFAQGEAEKLKLWKEYFDANPFWATAQRTERYVFTVMKNGKPKKWQASSVKEARDIVEKSGGTLRGEIEDQWKGKEDEPFAFPNLKPETVQRMQELEANQLAMLKNKVSPEVLADIERTSPITQILREATADQSIPGVQAPPRLLSQGAEDLPWMWNHISWVQKEATYWSRALLRAQARTYLLDPELASNPELRAKLSQHFDNLLQPDPRVAQQMNRFASVWFLGFNMATAMVNAAQPFVTHVAELTAISGKPVDSYMRVKKALSEIAGHHKGKGSWGSAEHQKFIEEATQDAQVGIGMYDDDAIAQEAVATNFKRAMMKNKVQSLGQKLDTLAGNYTTVGMAMFKMGERVNALSALLASFDLYREQGLSYADAKAKAYEFNRAVNYSGGRAQRPVGAFSGQGAFPRTVAMLATSLQSYVLGSTFQLIRYLQNGLFRPAGLTPHETFAARKALAQMLGTQFAAAGVLGMPFASGALSLLNAAFPDLELNKKLRELVNSFVAGDKEQGSVLSDIAMTGVPSMLGWDMQSRFSMGNTIPGVSEINGFQPENLMGPAANIVKNFVNGVTGWAKGDAKAGMNFMPPAAKKLVDAGSQWLGDGEIRDYQGRPLQAPTLGEHLGLALGFQPKRLSDQNAASRILAQSQEVANRDEARFRQQQAEEVLKGNFGTVRQAVLQRTSADKDYNPANAVKAIARAAEELHFPRDLRREGSRNTGSSRTSFLNTFSNLSNLQGSSEMDRLTFRSEVERRLGVSATSTQEVRLAQLMDQLKAASPGATRAELRAAAYQALRRASPQTSQLLPEGL